MTTLFPVSSESMAWPGDASSGLAKSFDARGTVISQYANSPILLALLSSLDDAIDPQPVVNGFYDTIWNVESANTHGLNVWGRIVGVSRTLYVSDGTYLGFSQSSDAVPFGSGIFYGGGTLTANYQLTNAAYRQVILAKAALNITDGSSSSINAILRALFPGYGNVWVRDNGDMTMTYVFAAPLSKVDYAIVTQSGVLPKPVGVSFDVEQP
ncbi:DUF2612 domain-containing protein [Nostoc ellipsosporum NOK]|nr:DUF2612 domain-containing protein [Nostoc ellipsosporum NOK]